MGRRRQRHALSVWMNGARAGIWRISASGTQEFSYDDAWIASPVGRPISLSLPTRRSEEPYRGSTVEAFFDNLLPDDREIRTRIQRRFGARTAAAFDLLAEVGSDCVGALQILPENASPPDITRITAEPLDAAGVEQALASSLGSPLGADVSNPEFFRLSLAGAQEKTALLLHDGTWRLPKGATPTTHILKLPIGVGAQGLDLSTSVENEWLSSRIVAAFGIPVAPCTIETFGAYKVLVVERFDRKRSADGAYWLRLPQEDFCQATATPSVLKYESDGGPGVRRVLEILRGSENAEADRADFFRTQIVFWLLAAIDGHAKNFSVFLLPGGSFRLTPRYDILSAHPLFGTGPGRLDPRRVTMAMAAYGKNRHYRWQEIQARHWLETARRAGLPDARTHMERILAETPAVLAQVRSRLPPHFPGHYADAVFAGIDSAADTLRAQLAVS